MGLKNINRKIILPVITAGVLYALAFPPVNLYFLIYLSFVLILDIANKSTTLKQVILRSYGIFFTASLVAVSWISLSGMQSDADTFLIFAGLFVLIVYPLFFIPPVALYYLINKRFYRTKMQWLSLASFPLLWTGFEYIQTLGQINFPWIFAGNTQTYNLSKIQFAEYTGLFGVSFWICFVSIILFILVKNISEKKLKPISAGSVFLIVVTAGIYFLPELFNAINTNQYPETGKIKVGIIQPNVNPWKKWSGKSDDLVNDYIEQIIGLQKNDPDINLAILPETALPYYFRERHFEDRYNKIKNVCDSLNLPLMIGTPDLEYYKDQSLAPPDAKIMSSSGLKYDTYNSAILFEPGKFKDDYQKHYKIKLVIGSERMPYQEYLAFTKSIVEWGVGLSSWQIGYDTNIFILPEGQKFNTAICYESVYPEFYSEFVNRGAEFSVIITNDGWWGKFFGTYQHNRFAVFRAIENRRWIARCANTGISDFIDPYGNMLMETPIGEKVNLVHEVGLIKEKTFYTRHGDLFAKICLWSGLGIFLGSLMVRKKQSPP